MCDIVVHLLGLAPLAFAIFGGLMAFNRGTVYSIVDRYTHQFFSEGFVIRTDEFVDKMTDYAMELIRPVALAIFIISLLLMVLSIYGGISNAFAKHGMIISYIVLLGVMLLVEVALLIAYGVKRGALVDTYVARYKTAASNYRSLQSAETDSLFSGLVMGLENCCGYENGAEYLTSTTLSPEDTFRFVNYNGLMYPITCCKIDILGTGQSTCPVTFTTEGSNINTGCAGPLRDKTIYFLNILAYSPILLLFTTITMFICAIITKFRVSASNS